MRSAGTQGEIEVTHDNSNFVYRLQQVQDDGGERGDRRPGTGAQLEIEKVIGVQEGVKFQIPMLPGLGIDGAVKSAGSVPSHDEIQKVLQQIGIN